MTQPNTPFDKRLKKILRRRDQLNSGSVIRVRSDGLIVEEPRRFRFRLPLRAISIIVICGFLFKGLFLVSIGAQSYADHVATLAQGSATARGAAWLMQADAVTIFIAEVLNKLIQ